MSHIARTTETTVAVENSPQSKGVTWSQVACCGIGGFTLLGITCIFAGRRLEGNVESGDISANFKIE